MFVLLKVQLIASSTTFYLHFKSAYQMSLRSGNVLVLDEAIQTEKHSPYLAGNTAVSQELTLAGNTAVSREVWGEQPTRCRLTSLGRRRPPRLYRDSRNERKIEELSHFCNWQMHLEYVDQVKRPSAEKCWGYLPVIKIFKTTQVIRLLVCGSG